MSVGDLYSYRLGYMNMCVKAYEGVEALKDLVIKSGKLKPNQSTSYATNKNGDRVLKTPDGKDLVL